MPPTPTPVRCPCTTSCRAYPKHPAAFDAMLLRWVKTAKTCCWSSAMPRTISPPCSILGWCTQKRPRPTSLDGLPAAKFKVEGLWASICPNAPLFDDFAEGVVIGADQLGKSLG